MPSRGIYNLSIVLVITLLLSTIVLGVLLFKTGGGSFSAAKDKVCVTPECVKSASYLLNNMKPEVNPCEDFYEYACGRWSELNPMTPAMAGYGSFGKLSRQVYSQLHELLSAPITKTDPLYSVKSKKMFQSCMNEGAIQNLGNTPLIDELQKLGGWPVYAGEAWKEDKFDFTKTLVSLNKLGINVFWTMAVGADDKDSDNNIIIVDQARLDLRSRKYFLDEKYKKQLNAYRLFTKEVAREICTKHVNADDQMKDMVEFSIKLANITLKYSERVMNDDLYNKYELSKLTTELTKYFEWSRYITDSFADVKYPITEDTKVLIYSKTFLLRLAKLIDETPKRVVANYMLWQLVRNTIKQLPSKNFGAIQQRFDEAIRGSRSQRKRSEQCISSTRQGDFGYAVGRMFVDRYFDKNAKTNADIMVDQLRFSIINMMKASDWMDSSTKKSAVEKAEAMNQNIGYPEEILNDDYLNNLLNEVNPSNRTFFENVLSIMKSERRSELDMILKPVDKTAWTLNPTVVNARSNEKKNLITFPAGILQHPFYSKDFNMAQNFGGIGTVIGHEITHEFDDLGSEYDKDGNMRKWWTKKVKEKFNEKTKCIEEQYNNYYVPEIKRHCNGKRTLGENIADIGGVKESYFAYQAYVKKYGEEQTLPVMGMSNNQLFFLSFAQLWCGKMRKQRYIAKVTSAHHSPGRFRVLGPLQNLPEFSKTFKCPSGSKMNPIKKCTIW